MSCFGFRLRRENEKEQEEENDAGGAAIRWSGRRDGRGAVFAQAQGAVGSVFDLEVAGVDVAQAAAVRDGEVGQTGQGGAELVVEGELGVLVDRGGGLVEEEPGRALEEYAGEGEALLFSA